MECQCIAWVCPSSFSNTRVKEKMGSCRNQEKRRVLHANMNSNIFLGKKPEKQKKSTLVCTSPRPVARAMFSASCWSLSRPIPCVPLLHQTPLFLRIHRWRIWSDERNSVCGIGLEWRRRRGSAGDHGRQMQVVGGEYCLRAGTNYPPSWQVMIRWWNNAWCLI
jgi:hypothetical protein